MQRVYVGLVLLTTGCSVQSVELFDVGTDGGFTDVATLFDATADDVALADAGVADVADAGLDAGGDAGTRVFRCPSEIAGEVFDFDAQPEGGIAVAAAPSWTRSAVQSASAQMLTTDVFTNTTPSSSSFGVSGAEGDRWSGPVVLSNWNVRRMTWAALTETQDGLQLEMAHIDDVETTRSTPQPIEVGWMLEDMVVQEGAIVLALTSSSGEARLERRSQVGSLTGWRSAQLSRDDLRVRQVRIDQSRDVVWFVQHTEFLFDGRWTPFFELQRLVDGRSRPGMSLLSCAEPPDFDVAAVDRETIALARRCGTQERVELLSTSPTAPGVILDTANFDRAPAQVAFDGRTLGVARWPVGASVPELRFYDDEGDALTEPLPFPQVEDYDPIAIRIDGKIHGDRSDWIIGLLVRTDSSARMLNVSFEGCGWVLE